MKKFILISLAFLILSGPVFADTIKVSVNGLVCAFCATGIEKTFMKQAAVEKVEVDLDNKLVTIGTRPNQKLDDDTVTRLINDAGYSVTGISRAK
jgi:copper chaperone CopZ